MSDWTRRKFLASTLWALAARVRPAWAQPELERDFRNPPQSSRLRMHWWVMGTAWTPEEAARQLRLMNEQHIGAVLIFPAYPVALDDPQRGIKNQRYLSQEFFEVLNSVVTTAKKLGFLVDIPIGPGWPYGGPSVTLEDASKMIQMASVRVNDGLARLPTLETGEKRVAVFHVDSGVAREIDGEPNREGMVSVSGATRGSEVQLFYYTPTRQEVKRASLGAEGLVLDHYNSTALNHYLDIVGRQLLEGVPKGSFRSFFCDSLEVYRANWTQRLPEFFRRKRGYDLIPHLPALFDDAHPDRRDLRHDFWRTLSEMAVEEFIKALGEWGHRHGIAVQVEAYGAPPVPLSSYLYIDYPCGEGFAWKGMTHSRWVSSGAHVAGKRLIMAEAWTWLGQPNRFGDSMEQLKVASDLHFLCGVNELYGVSYPYSPVELGAPGWPAYFGPTVNHTQPYWPHFHHLADYIARAGHVLRQGTAVVDIALYLAEEDNFADADVGQLQFSSRNQAGSGGRPAGKRFQGFLESGSDVVETIVTNGYCFDAVDTFVFEAGLRAEDGRLRMGDADYRVLVLPNLVGIDLSTLEKIAEFVRGGGTLIATRRLPETAYGLLRRPLDGPRVKALLAELFGDASPRSMRVHNYGAGQAIFCPDERASLLEALRSTLQPDITFVESSRYIGFAHRRAGRRDFYFVANAGFGPQRLGATFRVGAKQPQLWDLRTGRISPLPVFEHTSAGTGLSLKFEPFESKLIVFSDSDRRPIAAQTNFEKIHNWSGVWEGVARENGSYYAGAARMEVTGIPAAVVLSPRWRLSLTPPPAIAPIELETLKSWTEIPAARFYSGRGVYQAEFDFSPRKDLGVLLDLGRVHETAEVFVNDRPAGVAWMRPYEVEITQLLRSGKNRIRVEVTNLLINKVLGAGKIDYSALIARYGSRFPTGDEWDVVREPFISGLLGPVRLVFYRMVAIPLSPSA